ncbi:hypothetical protein, partial [Roseibium sp. RKSG952]|uniref:hypothetical protein n=1 Tax=Roseibium sp. RKSG952 TaxID=2529384 RepID=UPI001AD93179
NISACAEETLWYKLLKYQRADCMTQSKALEQNFAPAPISANADHVSTVLLRRSIRLSAAI